MNVAPRSLPENTQQRNIRRVKVNTQVAFAIYILEIIGMFSMMFVYVFFGITEFARTASIVLYYVVLPYIYLLNTSNNRDRITVDGWCNTLRNGLRMSTNNATEIHAQAQEETFNMQTYRSRVNQSKNSNSNIERTSAAIGQVGESKQKSGIYTVSYNKKETQTSDIDSESFILEVTACSSNGISRPSTEQHEVNHLNSPDSDDSDDNSSTPKRSRYLHLAEKILFEMVMNIGKEEIYIHYLKQLLVLGKATLLDEFKILMFSSLPAPKHYKGKTTKQNSRRRGNPDELEKSKNKKPQMAELNAHFLGRHLDRLDLRKSLLENYQDNCTDDETYKIFFNKICDFEESLFKEHHKS